MSLQIKGTVTRAKFCAAINAGFATMANGTERDRDALRQVATSAVVVGTTFGTCPLTLAFGNARDYLFVDFTLGYDPAMIVASRRSFGAGECLIRIVD